MQISIDLEKDAPEDLRMVIELIKRRIHFDDEGLNKEYNDNERIILTVIDNLINKLGKIVPISDIYDEAKKLNLSKKKVAEAIDFLKKNGEIFEVREGFIQKI